MKTQGKCLWGSQTGAEVPPDTAKHKPRVRKGQSTCANLQVRKGAPAALLPPSRPANIPKLYLLAYKQTT
jgi:hypothetical protein